MVDGNPLFRERDSALLQHFPWLLLLIPGVIHLLRRYKFNSLGILLAIALSYGLYFEYNDLAPDNIFRYHLIHYLFWTLPLLALHHIRRAKGSMEIPRRSVELLLSAFALVCSMFYNAAGGGDERNSG